MGGLTKEAMFNHAVQALRQHWMVVFLDGRNEHGSHVLQMPGDNVPREFHEHVVAVLDDQAARVGERIIKQSEQMGHAVGHCVVTVWDIQNDEGGVECRLRAIDPVLTCMLCGAPSEQHDNLHAFDLQPSTT